MHISDNIHFLEVIKCKQLFTIIWKILQNVDCTKVVSYGGIFFLKSSTLLSIPLSPLLQLFKLKSLKYRDSIVSNFTISNFVYFQFKKKTVGLALSFIIIDFSFKSQIIDIANNIFLIYILWYSGENKVLLLFI